MPQVRVGCLLGNCVLQQRLAAVVWSDMFDTMVDIFSLLLFSLAKAVDAPILGLLQAWPYYGHRWPHMAIYDNIIPILYMHRRRPASPPSPDGIVSDFWGVAALAFLMFFCSFAVFF